MACMSLLGWRDFWDGECFLKRRGHQGAPRGTAAPACISCLVCYPLAHRCLHCNIWSPMLASVVWYATRRAHQQFSTGSQPSPQVSLRNSGKEVENVEGLKLACLWKTKTSMDMQ